MMITDTEIVERLNQTFNNFFKTTTIALSPASTTADVPRWDSMNHVQIMIKVEEAFGIRFKHAEIAAFENVGDMIAAIHRKVNP